MDYHKLLLTVFTTFDVFNPKLFIPVHLTSRFLIPFMPFIPPLYHCICVDVSLPLFCTKKHLHAAKKTLNVRNLHLLFIIFVTPWPALGCHYSLYILVLYSKCFPQNPFPGIDIKHCCALLPASTSNMLVNGGFPSDMT